MDIQSLDLTKGMIARTLVIVDGRAYEVATMKTIDAVDKETAEFWHKLIEELPYESVVYPLVNSRKPYTKIEQELCEMVPINKEFRRDLETGDLFVVRTKDEDTAAMQHQAIIDEFKSGDILLFTFREREAIVGPNVP